MQRGCLLECCELGRNRRRLCGFAVLIVLLTSFTCCFSSLAFAATDETAYPSVTLWPLAYHQQDEQRARTDVLYPFFHYKREGSHSRFAIRPFLYNLEKDPQRDFRQMNILWPLSHFEVTGERFKRYVFPFYYHARDGDGFSFHVWPFYGHSFSADGTETWSTIYPFFQYQRNDMTGSRQFDYLWPLGRSQTKAESSSSYLFPLWWSKRAPGVRGKFILPYFMYETESTRQDALLPVWYRMRGGGEKLDFLLLWYAHEKDGYRFRTLLPFYWDYATGENRRLSLLVPFYGRYRNEQNDYQTLFPLYFRHTNLALESEFRYYFPLYGYYRKGEEIRHAYYLFPVYAHIEDDTIDREAWYFLWPLVYRDRWPEQSETWVVPLYWSKATPERKFRALLIPPYYSLEEPDKREIHFWPFYGLMQDQSYTERSVVWPLFRWGRNPAGDRRAWQCLLLYRGVEPEREILGLFPLWHYDPQQDRVRNVSLLHWHETSGEGDQFALLHLANPDWSLFSVKHEQGVNHQHLFPLYSYTQQQDPVGKKLYVLGPVYQYRTEGEDLVEHKFLWKVLYYEKSPEKKESGFLWRFIRSRKDADGSRLFEFNPFYYSEQRSDGDTFISWLGGLYSVRSGPGERKHTLFWMLNW